MSKQTISSSFPSVGFFDVSHVSSSFAAAVTTGDPGTLKARLAAIVKDIQSTNPKESHKSLAELNIFLDAVAEQSGTHVQNIFGQHVTCNMIFVAMDSVVKPALTQYCSITGKRRQVAMSRVRGRVNTTVSRRRVESSLTSNAAFSSAALSASVVAEEELDIFNSNKAKQLRMEVVRPWRILVETIHHNLPASLLRVRSSSTSISSSSSSSLLTSAACGGNNEDTQTGVNRRAHNGASNEAIVPNSFEAQSFSETTGVDGGGGKVATTWTGHNSLQNLWAAAPNHTSLPLLWKNAVPLFSITRHALEVLQSEVLVAVCGQEYAQLLLHLFFFNGYISNLQPRFIVELTMRLLRLVENTTYEFTGTDTAVNSTLTTGRLLQEGERNRPVVSGGCNTELNENDSDAYRPSVEEGTTYAALLVQLFRAPQLMSAFTPCEDGVAFVPSTSVTCEVTIPSIIQRLVCLATQRHLCPTSALRLEAHLLVALNLLVSAARDDYPVASATPVELVKPLCHLFYTTARRDGWRMEALAFMTTQICLCFSAVLGNSVRVDIERSRPTAPHPSCGVGDATGNDDINGGNRDERITTAMGGSALVAPRTLTLLHEIVLPFTFQFFMVARSEFSFLSRRELFHFPCAPLAPLFNFGAVVLYLACCTYEAYMALPSSSASFAVTAISTSTPADVSSPCSDVEHQEQNPRNKKRPREGENLNENRAENIERNTQMLGIQPGDAVLKLFRSLFFFDNMRDLKTTTTTSAAAKTTRSNEAVLENANEHVGANVDSNGLLWVSATAGGSLSAGAVQELVKDGSLFMLHLLAQPCTTLGFSERQCTLLVERGVLPLFPYYGVRLETLLLAVLHAVTPRTSITCQQEVFRWLVRRYMATVTTQRDDESQPKEQVYRLLAVILERCVVGRWPLPVHSEERGRLQAVAHFSAINARLRALLCEVSSTSSSLPATASVHQNKGLMPSVMRASLIAIAAGHRAKAGLSSPLFMAMLQFLSLYQHYGATSTEIIATHRTTEKKRFRHNSCKTVSEGHEQKEVLSTVVHLSTGLSFVVCAISHAVCFYPHDEGVNLNYDADTMTAVAATSAGTFLQALRWVEDYLLAVCVLTTENELGWHHSLTVGGRGGVDAAKNAATLSLRGGSKTAASLQRMKQLLAGSRHNIGAASIVPHKHVPLAVCEAAEGHWLLLHKLFTSSSLLTNDIRLTTTTVAASAVFAPYKNDSGDGNDDKSEVLPGQLRQGDVPIGVLEALAAEVVHVVGELAERAKVTTTVAREVVGGPGLQQQQRDVDEEAVALAHRTLCIHLVQLLHLLLRLFRLGIWRLPQSYRSHLDTVEVENYDSERRDHNVDEDDLHILSNVPQMQMFDNPLLIFRRLSQEGRLYYAVMWICRQLATRLLRGVLVRDHVVFRALLVLFNDVGAVLLSQSFALWEPRQVVLGFVGVVCRRALEEGIAKLAASLPRNATSVDAVEAVYVTMRLSCKLLGIILTIVRRTRVLMASADPLVNPTRVTAVLVDILEKDGLIPSMDNYNATNGDFNNINVNSLNTTGESTVQGVLKLNPFLPLSLSVVDGIAGLLRILHETYDDTQARLVLRRLLETLFARYRYGLAEGIFLSFSQYAPSYCAMTFSLTSDMEREDEDEEGEKDVNMQNDNKCDEEGDDGVYNGERDGSNVLAGDYSVNYPPKKGIVKEGRRGRVNKKLREGSDILLLLEEGQLLERFVDQLTDVSRTDMPILTPQLQCAVLSSIHALLFCCDAHVAEKLGKYLFSFLSTKTAYVVRRHTALQMRLLFNRFTNRAYNVLHELLYRAREGIVSMSPMHCATSLRALGEAAHAVPMMEADIICTLLECWATRGFAHKGLVLESLELIGSYSRIGDNDVTHTAAIKVLTGSGNGMSTRQLCHYHRERLLFDWLWRLSHPIEAFPIACFGYTKLQQMWQGLMPTLFPLALLCSARRSQGEETSVFLQPSDLLWRLTICHKERVSGLLKPERTKEVLIECLVAYFSDIMARLFLFASLSRRHEENNERQQPVLSQEEQRDIADAAHVALEWLRTMFSSDYAPLVRRNADAILCCFVGLAGTMAPIVRMQHMHRAVMMLCETVAEVTADGRHSLLCTMSTVDAFFSSDVGDHAYVLLQRLYVGLTCEVHRGLRRRLLILLFEHIVKRWWSRELLQRVPHILHTLLRLCGNILMKCVDARPRVCHVLLHIWAAVSSLSSDRIVAADKIFISTVMLGLSEESRVVTATWAAICRSDPSLQQRDWQLQHARYTAESFVQNEEEEGNNNNNKEEEVGEVVIVDSDADVEENKKLGEEKENLQQDKREKKNSTLTFHDAMRRVETILPLLKSTVLVTGAPASSFYVDVATAVDCNRAAFVTLIRMYAHEENEPQSSSVDIFATTKEDSCSKNFLRRTYETCCRAVQHLLALVCIDDTSDVVSRTIMTAPMVAAVATGTTATATLTVLQGTNGEVQRSGFCLLRALCWCFIEAGAEGHVDALLYPTGVMQELLQQLPFDEVLQRIYRQHMEHLYRLSFDADAYIAHIASMTLRGWLCGNTADNDEDESEDLPDLFGRVTMSTGRHVVASNNGSNNHRRGTGDDGKLITRTLEFIRDEEAKMLEPNINGLHEQSTESAATIRLDDMIAFRRRLVGVSVQASMMFTDETVSNVTSLLSDAVWEALSLHEDESRFLRLFLVAIIRHYNLHHRFCTLSTVLRCLLLQPLTDMSGSLLLFTENFLVVVLLHVMLVKENETQRAQRVVWSQSLETSLFQHALYFRRTTRLFLRALSVCHSVLMTVVRSHGVRLGCAEGQPLARMSSLESETVASSLTFPFFVSSDYGNLPELTDMRESYWLSDINPLVLASAAVACHEPHLALVFTEISGESLFGRRKGIPSAVMTTVGRSKCSVLFPSMHSKPSREGHQSAEGRGRVLRGEEAQLEMMKRLSTFRTSVHAIRVDAEALLRFRDIINYGYDDGGCENVADALGASTAVSSSRYGDDADGYTTPWEETFFMQHPMRLIEREKNRGNWHAVLLLLDRLENSNFFPCGTASIGNGNTCDNNNNNNDKDGGDGNKKVSNTDCVRLSKCDLLVEKANALMHLGASETALQMLASALKRNFSLSALTLSGKEHIKEEAEETEKERLRAALAAALWRMGRWDIGDLVEVGEEQQGYQGFSLPCLPSVDEAIFFALRCTHRGEYNDVRRWVVQAQQRLASQIDATNWFRTMLQAEVLHNIEESSERFIRQSSSLSPSLSSHHEVHVPPPWVHASLKYVHAPYQELELIDSVHQRLCVLYRQPQWWLSHLKGSSERALRGNRPLLVHQWLSAYAELSDSLGVNNGAVFERCLTSCNVATSSELPTMAFLALLQARAEFASGHPHRAIAILQNIETTATETSFRKGYLFPMPANAAQMPEIVQQLVVWAKEARLVPLSQLVRDPYLLLSVRNDNTGICCLQLARLCHTLVRDMAARLHSEEYRKLQESIEASIHTCAGLEQQQAAGGLNETETKILRHRIRTLAAETSREEDDWHREAETYALYRRSALNAYARFLERNGTADTDDLFAVFAFVSLWLQQDEKLSEHHLRDASSAVLATSGVIKKAMKSIPLHKFLPLFSQLVAQLGTSMDDKNLEKLVLYIAMEAPLHAIWPLLALTNGHTFGPKAGAVGGIGGVHVVDEKKVALSRQILCALKEVGNNSHPVSYENRIWRKRIVCEAERLSAAYIQMAFYRAHNSSRQVQRIPKGFMILEKDAQDLAIPPPTLSLPTSYFTSSASLHSLLQQLPHIVRYESTFMTPGGINLPKALTCVLSDGCVVRQLLKSEDDLRQDSLIEQVFCLSNQLLAKDQRTHRLRVCTYNVIPLAPTVGLIEWVDNTIPLGHYINGDTNVSGGAEGKRRCRIGAHERYFPGEPTTLDCRMRLQDASKAEKLSVLLELYAEFSPALHYFFLEHFFTPQEWLERREAYTRSVAASSIVGYIVGLGDRHGNNLLLHTQRAELVHIDLGFAFDQGKLLPVPELVPFRLTRNVVDGFGVQGSEGPFRHYCEGTLRVLRGRKELLMTILEACAHDPLARWAVTVVPQPQPQQRLQEEEDDDELAKRATPRQRVLGVNRGKPTYADAERTLSHVAEKIQGYESGELLSVPTHVHKLLQTAQNTELLSQMYVGWSPWL